MARTTRVFIALATLALGLGSPRPARADWIAFTSILQGTGNLSSAAPVTSFELTGAASFAPLGVASYASTGVIDFGIVSPDGSTPASGSFRYMFSGGDVLEGVFHENVFPPDPATGLFPITVRETITGGTGRFAGASGFADLTGSVRFTSASTTEFTASGVGVVTTIPEPSSLVMLGIGGLGMFVMNRCRRRGVPLDGGRSGQGPGTLGTGRPRGQDPHAVVT